MGMWVSFTRRRRKQKNSIKGRADCHVVHSRPPLPLKWWLVALEMQPLPFGHVGFVQRKEKEAKGFYHMRQTLKIYKAKYP